MPKSPDAFRTISEVADWLGIQAHVLRFWESKFTQVKPIKRAGGRRYYRPADMQLLGGIKKLLHEDGLTIKGVQKILREEGMSHVAALSVPLDEADAEAGVVATPPKLMQSPAPDAVVLPFETQKEPPAETVAPDEGDAVSASQAAEDAPEEAEVEAPDSAPEQAPEPEIQEPEPTVAADFSADAELDAEILQADAPTEPKEEPVQVAAAQAEDKKQDVVKADDAPEAEKTPAQPLPSFLRATPQKPKAKTPDVQETAPAETAPSTAEPATETPEPVKARDIGMPEVTPEAEIEAAPSNLSRLHRIRAIDAATAKDIKPLLAQLSALRDRMAAPRGGPSPNS
ncbi:MAG: MerR family transcriptional regulator [Sulfitobacter sp.]